jgi:hypothetical protein
MNSPVKVYNSKTARELATKYHLKLEDIPASNKKTNKVTIKNVRDTHRLTKSKKASPAKKVSPAKPKKQTKKSKQIKDLTGFKVKLLVKPVIDGQYNATDANMKVLKKWAEHVFPIAKGAWPTNLVSGETISTVITGMSGSLLISFVVSAKNRKNPGTYMNVVDTMKEVEFIIDQVRGGNLDDNADNPIFFDEEEGTLFLEQQTDLQGEDYLEDNLVQLKLLNKDIKPVYK